MKVNWWEENYIDTQSWILEHLEQLNLDAFETITVLMIVKLQKQHEIVQPDDLAKRCNFSEQQTDDILTRLVNKGYLSVKVLSSEVDYCLDGLFDNGDRSIAPTSMSIAEIFESEFQRPLSSSELEKLNDWLNRLDSQYLIHALREAVMYRKLSFTYIDRILSSWIKSKTTIEQLNEGKRNDDDTR